MSSTTPSLRGLRVLVTRPEALAKTLSRRIERAGGIALLFPVIRIEPPLDTQSRERALKMLADFDIAIFISPTAAQATLEAISPWPDHIQVAAIGSSTERYLTQHNIVVAISSNGHDSEALLEHTGLQSTQIAEKTLVIFRGEGGRMLLGDSLTARGASVVYANMYRRARPDNSLLGVEQLNNVDIIAVSSNEGLQNLFDLNTDPGLLIHKPLVVPGERCARLAIQLGFERIVRADNATDSACIAALAEWATNTAV